MPLDEKAVRLMRKRLTDRMNVRSAPRRKLPLPAEVRPVGLSTIEWKSLGGVRPVGFVLVEDNTAPVDGFMIESFTIDGHEQLVAPIPSLFFCNTDPPDMIMATGYDRFALTVCNVSGAPRRLPGWVLVLTGECR